MRRLSSATRTMKNSSRFELKMERNFTRSSSGTLGSCASSSTRRLNSSHDNSRLTNASGPPISPSTVERFAEQEPVAHPAGAHDEAEISAEEHGLLENRGSREDDVYPLRLEPPDLATLPRRQTLQPLADRRDVRLPHLQAVAMLALSRVRAQMDARQSPYRASQPHHDLPSPRRRQCTPELPPHLSAESLDLARPRPLMLQEERGGPHRAQGETRDRDDLSIAHPAQLEARASQVRHHAVLEGQAVERRVHTEARFVARAQDPHVDPLVAAERTEEALPIPGLPHGRGGHRDDARPPGISGIPRKEFVHRLECLVDRVAPQHARPAAAEPRGNALLDEHPIAGFRNDLGQEEADGRRAEVDDGDDLCHPARILS